MINIFKESWALYRRKFKVVIGIMLPAVVIGIPATAYLESTLGLSYGTFIIPSEMSIVFSLFFTALLFFMTLIISQLALSEAMKNEGISSSMAWLLGRKKPFNVFKTLKLLLKLFWFKHFIFLFLIWFACNAFMGIVLKPQIENLFLQQAMFSLTNFLLFIPFINLYGFCLYRKKNQLQSSAKNS